MAQDRNPYFTFTLITLLLVREIYPLDGIQIRPRDAQTQKNSTGKTPFDQLAKEIVQKHAAQAVGSNDVDQAGTNDPTTELSKEQRPGLEAALLMNSSRAQSTLTDLTNSSAFRANCPLNSSEGLGPKQNSALSKSTPSYLSDDSLALTRSPLSNGTHRPERCQSKSTAILTDEAGNNREYNQASLIETKQLEKQKTQINTTSKFLANESSINNTSIGKRDVALQPAKDTVSSNPVYIAPPSLDKSVTNTENPEDALVHNCTGRCGDENLFPCSCSDLCVLYQTCCENFNQDCPHILQDAKFRFENLVGADVRCGDYSVFKISSCPRHVWEDKQKTEPGDDNSLMHPSVTSENRLEQSSHTANILQSMIEVGTSTLSIPSSSKRSSKSITNSLKSAVLKAPVTDLSTGITYMNRTIYDCHNRHSTNSSLSTWALKLDYIYTNPKSLEDLGHLDGKDVYEPVFNQALLAHHLCLNDLIETCPSVWHGEELDAKCREFLAVTMSQASETVYSRWYRNRFCAYCNGGQNKSYELSYNINVFNKEVGLYMLMSIDNSGSFIIKARSPNLLRAHGLPWSRVQCQPTPTGQQEPLCSAQCNGVKISSDGYCKLPYAAKVALADDDLPPLCPEALPGLSRFISCGLKERIDSIPHAEFQSRSASVLLDSRTNKTLYVVDIEIKKPIPDNLFFSNDHKESIKNWRTFEILAKSFKDYRLSRDLCATTDTKGGRTEVVPQQVTTLSFDILLVSSHTMEMLSQDMERSLGPVTGTQNITTYCMSNIFEMEFYDIAPLVCKEAFTFYSDAKAIEDFRSSPCFSHLDNIRVVHSKGINILSDKGGLLSTLWVLVEVMEILT